ncbi:MAG: hypothetical protein ABF651_08320 [Sporolactobacillus sp.]
MRTFVFCSADDRQEICSLYPSFIIRTSTLRMAVQVFALRNKFEIVDFHVSVNGVARIHFLKEKWHRQKSFLYLVLVKKKVQSQKYGQEIPPLYTITGL